MKSMILAMIMKTEDAEVRTPQLACTTHRYMTAIMFNSKPFLIQILLFLQLKVVWAETQTVGCGVFECNTVTGLSFSDVVLLVCNYGPS